MRNLYPDKELLNLITTIFISSPNFSPKFRRLSSQFQSSGQASIHSRNLSSNRVGSSSNVGKTEGLSYESDEKFETLSDLGAGGGNRASPKSWSSVYSGGGVKSNSGAHLSTGEFATSTKKKGKGKTSWVCSDCGETFGQWWGICRSCGGEIKKFVEATEVESKATGYSVTDKVVGTWFGQKPGDLVPQRLTDVNKGINQLTWRIPLAGIFGAEVGKVLGGGLVPDCRI